MTVEQDVRKIQDNQLISDMLVSGILLIMALYHRLVLATPPRNGQLVVRFAVPGHDFQNRSHRRTLPDEILPALSRESRAHLRYLLVLCTGTRIRLDFQLFFRARISKVGTKSRLWHFYCLLDHLLIDSRTFSL